MCSALRTTFITLATLSSLVLCNNGPQFTQLTDPLIVAEDVPVGTILTNVTAVDDDGPQELAFSIPTSHPSYQFIELRDVTGSSLTGRTVNLVLKQALDRDYTEKTSMKIRIVVDDDPGRDSGNSIPREITMYIKDVNDEHPTFMQNRYEPEVSEDTAVGTTVLTVSANDPDSGLGGKVIYSMELVGQAADEAAFRIDQSGNIIVNGPLDASIHYIYEYKLIGKDKDDLEGNSILLIKIKDVQDKPPYFTNLPYSVTIQENAAVNSQVLQVTAFDGDRRIPNNITYSIVSDGSDNFNLDATSGWITIKTQLDRDAQEVKERGGVYAINVMAKETDPSQPLSSITATTLVTITVEDVNDNSPQFNSPTYVATILENMQEGVPITFTGPGDISVMNASDVDQGGNSHFELFLEKDGQAYDDFSPLPSEIYSESSVLIRVQNKTALDYEQVSSVTFQIVAREKNTPEMRSSIATVTVNIVDMNDNAPTLPPSYPVVNVSEDATATTNLIKINAIDQDRGDFGKITYSIRGGNGMFEIDPTSGQISLSGQLDREKVDSYFITAEARDGGGLTTVVNLEIHVTDVNDRHPVFRREEYYATVREDSLTFLRGNLVVEATDDDDPSTPNSQVMYRIVRASAGLEGKFFVNQSSGVVMLRELIDYESLPASLDGRVLLEVEAYDQGVPSLATSINITIEIEDVNDNSPLFDQARYVANIPESAVAGTRVLGVTATDGDATTPNNAFLYRVDSGAGDKFRINFQTGEVTVELGARLDRETKSFYSLNVSATDRGAKSLSGSCVVEITVTDVNDEPPMFAPAVISANVNENKNTGFTVKCVLADDADENSALTYSIIPGTVEANDDDYTWLCGGNQEDRSDINVISSGIDQYFSIHPSTGCITIQSELDRETAEVVVFKILAEDTNAVLVEGVNQQTATATVTITIDDYNDNAPQFIPNNTYQLNIPEGLARMSEVMRFDTRDADKNQAVSYRLVADPTNNFVIEAGTGRLQLRELLDRETQPQLELVVVAEDNGVPRMSSSATVAITVLDINDNSPTWRPYELAYTVREDAGLNSTVATIAAQDDDLGDFALIEYSIDISQDDGKLKIDKDTGKVYVWRSLDRETREQYTVYVTARDNPRDPNKQRTSQTKSITLTVADVNDNDPYFTNIDDNTVATVLEDKQNGHVVFEVSAADIDSGDNAKLEFNLLGNETTNELFDIETAMTMVGGVPTYVGNIKVISDLRGRVGKMKVNVTVTDRGSPSRSAETELIIKVEDVNLHDPVFVSPPGPRATINTPEEQSVGSLIMTIKASDEDHGRNAELRYEMLEENAWESFNLDPVSGNLTNTRKLNRESKASYEIKVQAKDNGVPYPRDSELLTLIIVLTDVDDQLPEFPRGSVYRPYIIKVEEESTDVVRDLNIAVDRDADVNAVTCYYIIGGDEEKVNFSLHQNGNLTLKAKLDRESLPQPSPVVNLIVWATPLCYDTSITSNLRPAVYPPTDYSSNLTLLWVQVEIQDINDNPPMFRQNMLTLGVTRDAGYGSALFNLQDLVTDADATKKVEFYELRTEQHLQNAQVSGKPFRVFLNGTVATNTYFQTNMGGYFLVFVQAQEKVAGGEPYTANATIRISLVNDDQRVKVVFRFPPDAVRAFQVTFNKKLEEVIGYRVVLDKIQTHENEFGQPEVNKTDMLIHGEDFKTNETIPASELLRVIDNFAEALLGVRYEYKVLEIVPTVKVVEEDSLENVYKMALILVTIVLSLLCIGISIVFYISRQQYKRKLKAATAMAYAVSKSDPGVTLSRVQGKVWRKVYADDIFTHQTNRGFQAPLDETFAHDENGGSHVLPGLDDMFEHETTRGSNSDLQKSEMPGTNVHAYENVNPIYLEKVLLQEAGEQNDEDESLDENAVDPSKPSSAFSEHQQSMNFYHEDNNLNKVPQSKIGNGDAILNSVLQHHEASKAKNNGVHNGGGHMSTFKQDNFDGLPTTEI